MPTPNPDAVETVPGTRETTKADEQESETTHHLTGSKLYLVLAGLGLAMYLFALDISVISTVRSAVNSHPPCS
jgi:hypothetical protein